MRFLHCADFHIDSPFAGASAAEREAGRARQLAAFGAAIDCIIAEHLPLCLIAGDLFDTAKPALGAVQAVAAGFARAGDCRFFITPGNHDPYTPDSVWATADFGENVTVFDTASVEHFDFDQTTRIYGFAFTEKEMRTSPLADLRLDAGMINLVVCHADLEDAHSTCCPTNERELAATGADYVALGHVHKGGTSERAGGTVYAYAGVACGRDFGECGAKGALLCTLDRSNGYTDLRTEFVPLTEHRFERISVDVSGSKDDADCAARLNAASAASGCGSTCAVRFTLTGELPADYQPSPSAIAAMTVGLAAVTITDMTRPTADRAALAADPTLRGEFYRALEQDLESADAAVRERAQLALKFGMAAMAGRNLDEIGL